MIQDRHRRRLRRGLTLLEVMITVAIMLLVTAVMVPSMSAYWMLEQRASAKEIALVYELLHDEAILRNETYRLVFDLDGGKWFVEKSTGAATIYASPEAREAAEERRAEKVEDMDPEELKAWKEEHASFQKIDGEHGLSKTFQLPQNTRFKSVFTPQYEEPVVPSAEQRSSGKKRSAEERAEAAIVASHIFPNGFVEYTVIQLVDVDDPESGFTITVDPMSGRVQLVAELLDQEDLWKWLPDEGPDLQL